MCLIPKLRFLQLDRERGLCNSLGRVVAGNRDIEVGTPERVSWNSHYRGFLFFFLANRAKIISKVSIRLFFDDNSYFVYFSFNCLISSFLSSSVSQISGVGTSLRSVSI